MRVLIIAALAITFFLIGFLFFGRKETMTNMGIEYGGFTKPDDIRSATDMIEEYHKTTKYKSINPEERAKNYEKGKIMVRKMKAEKKAFGKERVEKEIADEIKRYDLAKASMEKQGIKGATILLDFMRHDKMNELGVKYDLGILDSSYRNKNG